MVVLTEHIPQQEHAVFTSKPLAEVKETSNLGEVRLPEQKVWAVIPKVTPAFSLGKVELSEKEAEEILRKLIQAFQALRERKDLVVLSTQQPKHPPVSPHLPPKSWACARAWRGKTTSSTWKSPWRFTKTLTSPRKSAWRYWNLATAWEFPSRYTSCLRATLASTDAFRA
jgi:hypothetical protein